MDKIQDSIHVYTPLNSNPKYPQYFNPQKALTAGQKTAPIRRSMKWTSARNLNINEEKHA